MGGTIPESDQNRMVRTGSRVRLAMSPIEYIRRFEISMALVSDLQLLEMQTALYPFGMSEAKVRHFERVALGNPEG